jgi:hypothetical protein
VSSISNIGCESQEATVEAGDIVLYVG